MPELPEVETIRRGLERRLTGARIEAIEIRDGRLRRPLDAPTLESLRGRRIGGVGRRGKFLLFDVGEGLRWIVHLGMSGRLVLRPRDRPGLAHEHVRVTFDPAAVLVYVDPRRFGSMRVAPEADLEELRFLGPEPLDPKFDLESVCRLRSSRRAVKTALLDQRLIAGIGNIYANEILFRAGVRPTRRGVRLRRAELERIVAATRAVLLEAIERRGTSFSDYLDSDGLPGTFQTALAVFDREGEPCRRCGAAVRRKAHGGRSSFYCPACQR